ncbi:hypothetical protein BJ165DRAFT_1533247 [Panaeolus papilionaceus]|nr:hypothetical protein BJ165DRAFT_1533247 [Panaeolus papilionaceus]
MSTPLGFRRMGHDATDLSNSGFATGYPTSSPGYFKGFHSSSEYGGDPESAMGDPVLNYQTYPSSPSLAATNTTFHQAIESDTQPAVQSPAIEQHAQETTSTKEGTVGTAGPEHQRIDAFGAVILQDEDPLTWTGFSLKRGRKPMSSTQLQGLEFYRKQCDVLRGLNLNLQNQLRQAEATIAMLTYRLEGVTKKYLEMGDILGLVDTVANLESENDNGYSSR